MASRFMEVCHSSWGFLRVFYFSPRFDTLMLSTSSLIYFENLRNIVWQCRKPLAIPWFHDMFSSLIASWQGFDQWKNFISVRAAKSKPKIVRTAHLEMQPEAAWRCLLVWCLHAPKQCNPCAKIDALAYSIIFRLRAVTPHRCQSSESSNLQCVRTTESPFDPFSFSMLKESESSAKKRFIWHSS